MAVRSGWPAPAGRERRALIGAGDVGGPSRTMGRNPHGEMYMSAPSVAPGPAHDSRSAPLGGRPFARRIARPFARLPKALLFPVAALLLAACAGTASPTLAPASASPSAVASPSAAASSSAGAPCAAGGLAVTAAPWGGAAGSRGTDVTVVNQGAVDCVLPAAPQVAVVDAGGNVLAQSRQPTGSAGTVIQPSQTIGFSVLLGNWCNTSVSLPLHVRLALGSGAVDIAGSTLATSDDLPPCNGPGQPPSLSASEWQPH